MSRRKTTEEIIEEFKKVHGNRYGYSLVEYVNNRDKVKIICHEHGVFEQNSESHKKGHGCVKCSINDASKRYMMSKEDFIKKSKLVHGDKYKYDKVDYRGNKIKIIISCDVHGDFTQIPSKHMSGQGCRLCSNLAKGDRKRYSKEWFVKQAKLVHGDKYIYDEVKYHNSLTKVKIKCKKHGYFLQSPNSHLKGVGCPECGLIICANNNRENPVGWSITSWNKAGLKSKSFDSFKVYIIKCYGNGEEFYKIGRTYKKVENRFRGKKAMPYNYEVIKELIFDNAKDAYNKENELKKLNKKHSYVPKINFGGQYECFKTVSI